MRSILVALKRPVSDAARGYLEQMEDDKWLDRLSVEYPSRRVFRFWTPGGGFDHNVFREKTVPAVIDTIHANPVRRGLGWVAHGFSRGGREYGWNRRPDRLGVVERAVLGGLAGRAHSYG
ncbi:MAG TPA: hypothetical protein VM487_20120 [Phycisphaerae bacterium]|nr:hypothetical protein [Phycisphaerae bacterium]